MTEEPDTRSPTRTRHVRVAPHLWCWDPTKEVARCAICGITRALAQAHGILDQCQGRWAVDAVPGAGIGSGSQGGQHPGA